MADNIFLIGYFEALFIDCCFQCVHLGNVHFGKVNFEEDASNIQLSTTNGATQSRSSDVDSICYYLKMDHFIFHESIVTLYHSDRSIFNLLSLFFKKKMSLVLRFSREYQMEMRFLIFAKKSCGN